jgi:hypothetical protein
VPQGSGGGGAKSGGGGGKSSSSSSTAESATEHEAVLKDFLHYLWGLPAYETYLKLILREAYSTLRGTELREEDYLGAPGLEEVKIDGGIFSSDSDQGGEGQGLSPRDLQLQNLNTNSESGQEGGSMSLTGFSAAHYNSSTGQPHHLSRLSLPQNSTTFFKVPAQRTSNYPKRFVPFPVFCETEGVEELQTALENAESFREVRRRERGTLEKIREERQRAWKLEEKTRSLMIGMTVNERENYAREQKAAAAAGKAQGGAKKKAGAKKI